MSRKRRLLCVYQHAPTPGAPGIYRHRLLLSELVRRGWRVDLVSTPVNYMTGDVPSSYRHRAYTRETIDGIVHHWVYAPSGIHDSKGRRVLNYVTFATAAALRAATLRRPDVILISSPPLSVGAIGPLLAARFRRPWLLEVRDLWPDSAASVGWLTTTSLPYRALDRVARRLASRAAAVVVPTSGLVAGVAGHGASTVRVISGAVVGLPTDENQRRAFRETLGIASSTCVFLYAGAIGVANGLEIVVDALAQLGPEIDVLVLVVGDGSARAGLETHVAALGVTRLRLFGAVPRDQVGDFLAAADVGLHALRPDPLFASALPTKVLEYLGAGLPFVTTVPGLPQRLARATGGGFASGAEELAAEFVRWSGMTAEERVACGERSRAFGIERFGLTAVVDRLESMLVAATEGALMPGEAVPFPAEGGKAAR
jgi:putative colanic acid biosynthesis glycosyltransferase WcaI